MTYNYGENENSPKMLGVGSRGSRKFFQEISNSREPLLRLVCQTGEHLMPTFMRSCFEGGRNRKTGSGALPDRSTRGIGNPADLIHLSNARGAALRSPFGRTDASRVGPARRRIAAWASPTRLFGAEVRVMPC